MKWCIGPISEPPTTAPNSFSFPLYQIAGDVSLNEALWEAGVLLEHPRPEGKNLTALVVWDDDDDDYFAYVVYRRTWAPFAGNDVNWRKWFKHAVNMDAAVERETARRAMTNDRMERFHRVERDRTVALEAVGKGMRELKRAAQYLPVLDAEIADIETTVCMAVTAGDWWREVSHATDVSLVHPEEDLVKLVNRIDHWAQQNPVWS